MNRRELAQAMRGAKQRPRVIESRDHYIGVTGGHCLVCALGAALIENYGGDFIKAHEDFCARYEESWSRGDLPMQLQGVRVLSEMLGVDFELAADVSQAHSIERATIAEIASWLESSDGEEATNA